MDDSAGSFASRGRGAGDARKLELFEGHSSSAAGRIADGVYIAVENIVELTRAGRRIRAGIIDN